MLPCARAAPAARTRARREKDGGEPLTRRGLPQLASRLSALPGVRDLSLSSNGTRLARYAEELAAAGVSRVNISLDTLDRDCMKGITGRDCLPSVLAGGVSAS